MKTAVVTGAAGGMGQAICRQLRADGFHVFGLDLNEEGLGELATELGSDFAPICVDITDPIAIAHTFDGIRSEYCGLDALVNNAGTCFMSDFPHIPPEELEKQMAINFNSAFHCCQQAVQLMLVREGIKKIVNISSNGAYNFDVFDPPHYRASKAALDTLTKDLARRYAQEKICVNSLAPAMTETPLFNVLTKEVLEKAVSAMPHGRAMLPEQIASWVGLSPLLPSELPRNGLKCQGLWHCHQK